MNLKNVWCLFVVALQSVSLEAAKPIKRNTYNTLDIKWIEVYEYDAKVLVDFITTKKAVRGKVGLFRVGVTLVKPLDYMKAECNIFQRLSSNFYQPTVLSHLIFDFCSIMKNNESMLLLGRLATPIYPKFMETVMKYKEYLHPCPFLPGRYDVIEVLDELIVPDFAPIVDGKIICRCYDRNNRTMADIRTYFVVKRGFPVV